MSRVHGLLAALTISPDPAYRNARQHSDKQNARLEHDRALERVITGMVTDDAELFKQFFDNPGFRCWLADTVFGLTYTPANG